MKKTIMQNGFKETPDKVWRQDDLEDENLDENHGAPQIETTAPMATLGKKRMLILDVWILNNLFDHLSGGSDDDGGDNKMKGGHEEDD